jgi:hypothetical protein
VVTRDCGVVRCPGVCLRWFGRGCWKWFGAIGFTLVPSYIERARAEVKRAAVYSTALAGGKNLFRPARMPSLEELHAVHCQAGAFTRSHFSST